MLEFWVFVVFEKSHQMCAFVFTKLILLLVKETRRQSSWRTIRFTRIIRRLVEWTKKFRFRKVISGYNQMIDVFCQMFPNLIGVTLFVRIIYLVWISTPCSGTINGLRFLGFLIGAPLWGILADLRKKHSIIIFILCVTAMTLMTSQPFFSMSMGGKSYCEVEADATTSIGNTSIHHHHTMKGKGSGGSANSTSMDNSNNTPFDSSSKLFTSMFAINILIR